ncbi:MAG: Rrf2 family transcriptional regulator [Candidatus Omnitrophica bacterium]|nr:Rrf2 family transcriptional regulator [Candidatus Omnitrophota bacterium]
MRFITRDTDYALRALLFMARALRHENKKIVTVEDIVAEEKLPRVFLRRILQKLAVKGVLSSYKGKAGGFSFAMVPKKISLADVIIVYQGEIDLTNCFLQGKICPNRTRCKVRKKIKAINAKLIKELGGINIEELSG